MHVFVDIYVRLMDVFVYMATREIDFFSGAINDVTFLVVFQEAYNNIPIETKVTFLFASLHDATMDESMRSMSAVLLRRLFASDFQDFYPKLPAEGQAQFKQQVLQTLQVQQSPIVRKKVGCFFFNGDKYFDANAFFIPLIFSFLGVRCGRRSC